MNRKNVNINSGRIVNIRGMKYLHFVLFLFSFVAAWYFFQLEIGYFVRPRYDIMVVGVYAVLSFFFIRTYNGYLVEYSGHKDLSFSLCMASLIMNVGTYLGLSVIWNHFYGPYPFIGLCAVQFALSIFWARFAERRFLKKNPPRKSVLVYRYEKDQSRISEIKKYDHHFDIQKTVNVGNAEQIDTVIGELGEYDVIFVAGVAATLRNGIAKYCVEENKQGYFMPHVGDVIMAGADHIQTFSSPILSVTRTELNPEYVLFKRLSDILLSLCGIIITCPIMLITAIAIKCTDHGPVFYRQNRLTKDGKVFEIIKFRSMRVDAEKDGVARLASENDDRITPVGKFIRSCRIDELPQLFNILMGDMTIVGPRPERPEIAEQYEEIIPSFKLRLQVKAGLTGYAQVYGKYNSDPYDKLQLDLLYINQMSIVTDLQLIFATLKILFIKSSTEGVEEGKTTAR